MYRITRTTDKSQMIERPPFGPSFSQEQVDRADAMEVWGTSMNDAGEYCEFRLFAGAEVIATRRIAGY